MGRKLVLLLFLSAGLWRYSPAQGIIENPVKALSPKAGRVVAVEEVMRIEDTGKDYFFKAIYGIRVSPGGAIFVNSGFEQVIQFDAKGRFVRNLVKNGQGPGEMASVSDVFASDDRVYLVSARQKILILDLDGRLLAEISLRMAGGPVTKIIGANAGLIFAKRENSPKAGEVGQFECPEDILAVSTATGAISVIGSFPLPCFAFRYNDDWHSGRNASLIAVPFKDRQLFLTHRPEYLIKLFDAGTGQVLRAFRRDYPRIRQESPGQITDLDPGLARQMKAFIPKDLNDINDLHIVDGRLWVQTSTFDPEKGLLFDVFDPEGHFEDSFFLKWWPGKPAGADARKRLTFAGGFVYLSETTEDGLIVIKKGRLLL